MTDTHNLEVLGGGGASGGRGIDAIGSTAIWELRVEGVPKGGASAKGVGVV